MDFSNTPPLSPESLPSMRNEPASTAAKARAERQTSDSGPASRAAVAVACTNCRSRHLKCDGQQPCSRCVQEVLADCSYMKSRRGWKGPRKQETGVPYAGVSSMPMTNAQGLGLNNGLLSLSPTLDTSILQSAGLNSETVQMTSQSGGFNLELLIPVENTGQLVLAPPPPALLPMDTSAQGLINAFYTYFFPAHPFVLPYVQMQEMLRKIPINHLQLALQYIGSFYVVGAEKNIFEASLRHLFANYTGQKDHYYVQALVLFSVGLHMADKEHESSEVMYNAINESKALEMDQRNYATMNGGINTILEECLRRTWWEIWVLDGMMTGVNPEYRMQLGQADVMDLPLPNEEIEYFQGRTPIVIRTLQDYDDSIFLGGDDEIFSSSTYRIDAIRIVHGVMAATRGVAGDIMAQEAFEMAETQIKNWAFFLPEPKKKPIDRDGVVDEVLFEAHMIVSACTILLNRPRSDLHTEEVLPVTACMGSGPLTLPSHFKEYHTANSMNAAMNICMLIKIPCPLVKHSPFFTCAITMAAVVYLAYWSFIVTEDRDKVIKEHIRLNIGSLKAMAPVMPIANTVLGQVKGVAQELFASKKAIRNSVYSNGTREQIFEGMIVEDLPSSSLASSTASGITISPTLTYFDGNGLS